MVGSMYSYRKDLITFIFSLYKKQISSKMESLALLRHSFSVGDWFCKGWLKVKENQSRRQFQWRKFV